MSIQDEFAEVAIELIDTFAPDGNNAIYIEKGELVETNPDEPWKDAASVNPQEFNVRCIFLPDKLEDRQIQMYLKGSSIGSGKVNGWMYPSQAIKPKLNDVIRRPNELDPSNPSDFDEFTILAINEFRPENRTLVYFFEFGT